MIERKWRRAPVLMSYVSRSLPPTSTPGMEVLQTIIWRMASQGGHNWSREGDPTPLDTYQVDLSNIHTDEDTDAIKYECHSRSPPPLDYTLWINFYSLWNILTLSLISLTGLFINSPTYRKRVQTFCNTRVFRAFPLASTIHWRVKLNKSELL